VGDPRPSVVAGQALAGGRKDILLRIEDVVAEAGTGFAFPVDAQGRWLVRAKGE
jgi:hypothetical protein